MIMKDYSINVLIIKNGFDLKSEIWNLTNVKSENEWCFILHYKYIYYNEPYSPFSILLITIFIWVWFL